MCTIASIMTTIIIFVFSVRIHIHIIITIIRRTRPELLVSFSVLLCIFRYTILQYLYNDVDRNTNM